MRAARTPARRKFRVPLMVCLRGTFALKQRRPPNWEPSPSPSQALACLLNYAKCLFLLAEAVRFELTDGRPSPVFKTGAFNRSATLPNSSYNCFQDQCLKPLGHTSGEGAAVYPWRRRIASGAGVNGRWLARQRSGGGCLWPEWSRSGCGLRHPAWPRRDSCPVAASPA